MRCHQVERQDLRGLRVVQGYQSRVEMEPGVRGESRVLLALRDLRELLELLVQEGRRDRLVLISPDGTERRVGMVCRFQGQQVRKGRRVERVRRGRKGS